MDWSVGVFPLVYSTSTGFTDSPGGITESGAKSVVYGCLVCVIFSGLYLRRARRPALNSATTRPSHSSAGLSMATAPTTAATRSARSSKTTSGPTRCSTSWYDASCCVPIVCKSSCYCYITGLMGPFSRTTWIIQYQKCKTSLDLNDTRDDGVLG